MSNDKAIWDALNTGSVEAVAAALTPDEIKRLNLTEPTHESMVADGWMPKDGIVNLSEAIELAPLTEAITSRLAPEDLAAPFPFKLESYIKPVDEAKERADFELAVSRVKHLSEHRPMMWWAWLERARRG